MKNLQHNGKEPSDNLIRTDEGLASAKKWVENNDELFRRLADDDRFERFLEKAKREYSKTLKDLAEGDKNP